MAKCSSAQKSFKGGWEWGRAGAGRGSRVFIVILTYWLGFWLGLGLAIQFVYPDVVMVIFSSPICDVIKKNIVIPGMITDKLYVGIIR